MGLGRQLVEEISEGLEVEEEEGVAVLEGPREELAAAIVDEAARGFPNPRSPKKKDSNLGPSWNGMLSVQ